jgi:hypothetical protein
VEGYNCPFQGKTFDESGFQIDHLIEIADGGTNDIDNLQALCPCCHSFKTLQSARSRVSKPKEKKEPKKKIDYIELSKILTSGETVSNCEKQIRNILGWEQPEDIDFRKFENRGKTNDQLIPYLQSKGVPYTTINPDLGYCNIRQTGHPSFQKIKVDLEAFIKSLSKEYTVVRPK